jgi:hypothetical protein
MRLAGPADPGLVHGACSEIILSGAPAMVPASIVAAAPPIPDRSDGPGRSP